MIDAAQFIWLIWTPGVTELLVIFAIALLIFGSTKLAGIGTGLGQAIRNFRKGLKGEDPAELEAPRSEKKD